MTYQPRGPIVLPILLIAGFVLGAWASQNSPLARQPVPAAKAAQPSELPGLFAVQGRGWTDAGAALSLATERLPFRPLVPTELPPGYALAQSNANAFADGYGLVDLVYLGSGLGQLQLFEANRSPDKPMIAPVANGETIAIQGTTWDYRLLSFPQPDGSRLYVHALMGTVQGIYVSVAIHSMGDRPGERAALIRIASSLR